MKYIIFLGGDEEDAHESIIRSLLSRFLKRCFRSKYRLRQAAKRRMSMLQKRASTMRNKKSKSGSGGEEIIVTGNNNTLEQNAGEKKNRQKLLSSAQTVSYITEQEQLPQENAMNRIKSEYQAKIVEKQTEEIEKERLQAQAITIRRNSEFNKQLHTEQVLEREKVADARVQQRLQLRQKAKQTGALKKCKAFEMLTDISINHIVDLMTYQKLDKDTVLCKQGDLANCMYLLMSGSVKVTIKKEEIAILGELSVFGESALFGKDTKRNATVTTTKDDVQVLMLGRSELNELMLSGSLNGACMQHIKEVNQQRTMSNLKKAETSSA